MIQVQLQVHGSAIRLGLVLSIRTGVLVHAILCTLYIDAYIGGELEFIWCLHRKLDSFIKVRLTLAYALFIDVYQCDFVLVRSYGIKQN